MYSMQFCVIVHCSLQYFVSVSCDICSSFFKCGYVRITNASVMDAGEFKRNSVTFEMFESGNNEVMMI